ncbi:MAG: DUF47 family protein [Phycisphaerae bacterium]|nr:DUF47 family protein [Phycisphaerae bacterium]
MLGIFTKEDVFFSLFRKSAQNVHDAAKLLMDLLTNFTDVANRAHQIHNLEHQGDEFTHQILEYLAKTFITPLDREDIHKVATRLDDIIDQMSTAANRLSLYQVKTIPSDARALGEVLVTATALLIQAFDGLNNKKKFAEVTNCCVQIHTQENEGDRLMQHALAELFTASNPDPVEIIKWKDIFQILEKATDRCEDVADAMQSIVVKHG